MGLEANAGTRSITDDTVTDRASLKSAMLSVNLLYDFTLDATMQGNSVQKASFSRGSGAVAPLSTKIRRTNFVAEQTT
jgi:hypothetical protein